MDVIGPREGGIRTYKPMPQLPPGSRVAQGRAREQCVLKEAGPTWLPLVAALPATVEASRVQTDP